jgi:uncharacterized membrane protein YgdD (TMEM256/DUF423 family)
MDRVWLVAGGLVGFTAVLAAALGAHALRGVLSPEALGLFGTAQAVQAWHAAALLGCGLWARQRPGCLVHWGAGLMLLGLLGFCGAIYALAFGTSLGMLAPVGGMVLMAGWLVLAIAALA